MKRALAVVGAALTAACTYALFWAPDSWAHTPALVATCTQATLTAQSYPAGSTMRLEVDGVLAASKTLTQPSYANAPAVLVATYPGTGHTVRGAIHSTDTYPDFSQTLDVTPCQTQTQTPTPSASTSQPTPSPTASLSTSPSTPSPSVTPTPSATSPSPSPSDSKPTTTPSVRQSPPGKPKPSAPPSSPGPQLPHTGNEPALLAGALVLGGSGIALVTLARRRRS